MDGLATADSQQATKDEGCRPRAARDRAGSQGRRCCRAVTPTSAAGSQSGCLLASPSCLACRFQPSSAHSVARSWPAAHSAERCLSSACPAAAAAGATVSALAACAASRPWVEEGTVVGQLPLLLLLAALDGWMDGNGRIARRQHRSSSSSALAR